MLDLHKLPKRTQVSDFLLVHFFFRFDFKFLFCIDHKNFMMSLDRSFL